MSEPESTTRAIQVTFDCADPRALSRFWAAAMGYVVPAPSGRDVAEGEDVFAAWEQFLAETGVPREMWDNWSAAEDPAGVGPRLYFQKVPEEKVSKNRVHLDVRAAPGMRGEERMAALEDEAERLVALGATRLRRFEPEPPMSLGFITMQDPEGNEFDLD